MTQFSFRADELFPLTTVDLTPYYNVRIMQRTCKLRIISTLQADATVTPA